MVIKRVASPADISATAGGASKVEVRSVGLRRSAVVRLAFVVVAAVYACVGALSADAAGILPAVV